MIQNVLSQLNFSFYRHQPTLADFSGGQITRDAGLLPLRALNEKQVKALADAEASLLARLIVANARMQSKIYKILCSEQQKKLSDLERTQAHSHRKGSERSLATVEGAQAAYDSVAQLRREPAGLVRLSSPVGVWLMHSPAT